MNLKKCFEKVQLISELKENWDGYGTSVPLEQVINNTYDFLETVHQYNTNIKVDEDEIVPTPYGSITIDLYPFEGKSVDGEVLISIEIGSKEIGWFTGWSVGGKLDREEYESNGTPTDFKTLPKNLKWVLDYFYKWFPFDEDFKEMKDAFINENF